MILCLIGIQVSTFHMKILQRLEWLVKTAWSHKLAINSIEDLFTPNIHVVTFVFIVGTFERTRNRKRFTIGF